MRTIEIRDKSGYNTMGMVEDPIFELGKHYMSQVILLLKPIEESKFLSQAFGNYNFGLTLNVDSKRISLYMNDKLSAKFCDASTRFFNLSR